MFEIPTSAVLVDGKKVKYFDFISPLQNEDCNRALERRTPRIDMGAIERLIHSTPFLSDLQQRFYLTMMKGRIAKSSTSLCRS